MTAREFLMAAPQAIAHADYINEQFKWKSTDPNQPPNATSAFRDFRTAHAEVTDFSHISFEGIDFRGANFEGLNLSNVTFRNCILRNATFNSIDGTALSIVNDGATLVVPDIAEKTLEKFRSADASNAKFASADLRKATLKCRFTSASFRAATLTYAKLSGCEFDNAEFDLAYLSEADLRSVAVNDGTSFKRLRSCLRCKVDRRFLHSLGESFGGLTVGMQSDLRIEDDFILLRSRFSGLWRIAHIGALISFIAPYLWFVASNWALARFSLSSQDSSITLFEATLRFIVNGGKDWQDGWSPNYLSLACFVGILLFNALRGILLLKTLSLEHLEKITGVPSTFNLSTSVADVLGIDGLRKLVNTLLKARPKWLSSLLVEVVVLTTWEQLLRIMNWGYWVMLLLVAYNTWHFLQQRIPI